MYIHITTEKPENDVGTSYSQFIYPITPVESFL